MRLITKKLWRAFPELDRFDDEKCRRFVKTAQRGFAPMLGRLALNLAAFVFVVTALIAAGGTLVTVFATPDINVSPAMGGMGQRFNSNAFMYGWVAVVVGAVVAACMTSLVVRDQLLRRRVALFIKARGHCPRCRYTLLGIRVPESLKINCPECGLELEVDEALTELAPSAGGGRPSDGTPTVREGPLSTIEGSPPPATPPAASRDRRFVRAPEETGWLPKWVTPRARRWLVRGAIVLPILVVVVPAAWWGLSWWSLQRQAARASAARVGLVNIDKISESLNPPDDGSRDAWDIFEGLHLVMQQAETEVEAAVTPDMVEGIEKRWANDQPFCDFALLVRSYREADPSRSKGFGRINADLARKALARMAELGIDRHLEALIGARRAVMRMPTFVPGQPPDVTSVPYSELRQACLALCGRMSEAISANDEAEFTLALRGALALTRMIERHPIFVSRLVSSLLEWMILELLQDELARSSPWPLARLDAVEAALLEFSVGNVPMRAVLNGEREHGLDMMRHMFENAACIGLGQAVAAAARFAPDGTENLPIGSLEENEADLNLYIDAIIAVAEREGQESGSEPPSPRFLPVASLVPWMARATENDRATLVYRRGVRLLIAIERFRAARGRPPGSLGSLVPEFLHEIPKDPFAKDAKFRYRVDPGGYILYSVGADGEDHGGVGDIADRASLDKSKSGAPADFILHRPPNKP
ncbi:MAG: hypothetical protein ACKVZJ_11445 [Phycisphaerales bacterium]